jgi:hypothetical protein
MCYLLRRMSPVLALRVISNPRPKMSLLGQQRTKVGLNGPAAIDPTATLDVHCGNGFDAGLAPIEVLV